MRLPMKQLSRCLIKIFCLLFGTKKHHGKINPQRIKRILLMGNDKLGDTIVLTPVFNALHLINDKIEIDCFGYDASYDVLVGDRRLTKLYRYKQDFSIIRLCKMMRQREYDLILSLTWRKGLREGLLALWGSVQKTVRVTIYRKPKYAPFWNKMIRVPNSVYHTAEKYLYLLEQLFEINKPLPVIMSIDVRSEATRRIEQFLEDSNIEPFILINLSAGDYEMTKDEMRCWTKAQYVELISRLLQTFPTTDFVLVSVPKDVVHARWIQAQCASQQVHLFPPTSNVHDVVALVSKADLLISPDTSLIHMASAVGTPTVGLFSNKGKIETWGSYHVPNRMLAASPNDYRMTPLSKISVDSVLQATLELMKEQIRSSKVVNK